MSSVSANAPYRMDDSCDHIASCLPSLSALKILSSRAECGQNITISPSTSNPHINFLPTELLIEVFAYCSVNDAFSPVFLRLVSRRWKDIIDTSPLVWQHLSFDDELYTLPIMHHQADLWLAKSFPLDFDVEVNVANLDNLLPIISPLLPYIERWRSFTLAGQREEEVDMSELELNPSLLGHLNIYIYDWDMDYPEEDDMKSTFASTWSSNYTMNVWLYKLPSYHIMTPLRFTCLSIYEGTFASVFTQPSTVLEFLRACPELESFHFSGWTHNGTFSDEKFPVVSLPHLHTLHLKSTCSARTYLSSLDVPQLENLCLSYLNVDFKLTGDYNEPGDSEDEAGDYSQSPWSDQATGMGLRNLINRCNPPIKVLEMDFSDMRTKDFRYVFDRLVDLEEFSIVASDMSDKVIKLFRPTFLENGSTQVRLPHLRQLRLYNCQRLSGDAVVNALVQRVSQTDRYTPSDTLKEVTIVGCDGFTGVHEVQLERTLRDRVRYE